MIWTDERDEELTRLRSSGKSFGAIAKEMGEGLTRNAIAGRLHRLKTIGLRKIKRPETPEIVETKEETPQGPIRLDELTRNTCHAPTRVGSVTMYCGLPTDGTPYCSDHHRLFSRPSILRRN